MRWLALVPWLDKKILLALTLAVAAAGTGYAVFTSGASAPAPPGVSSRVLDSATGDPLGGVSVQVTDEDGVDLPVPAVITAADGTFSIDGFSHTTIGLRVDGAAVDFEQGFVTCETLGHGRTVHPSASFACAISADFTDDIALDRTFLRARVVNSTTGEPVGGALVHVTDETGTILGIAAATTAPDGSFTIRGISRDEIGIFVDGAAVGFETGFVETNPSCAVPHGAEVVASWRSVRCTNTTSTLFTRDIALDPVFSTPQVVDSETGDPVAGVLIALTNEHGTDIPGATTTTAADGTYILPSVPHEEISIRVDGSAVGYESGFTPGFPLEPFGWAVHPTHGEVVNTGPSFAADISLDRLPDPVDYRARVVDGWNHLPVENVTVQLVDPFGVSISGYSATTAADGTFTIPGVRSSEVVILVDGAAIEYQRGYVGCRSPYHPEEPHLVEVVSGLGDACAWAPTYSDDIALFQTVVGSRVFDGATGLPLENVEVSLIDAATDAVVFTRRTGADGSYRFTSVPTRELLLRIDGSGIGYEDGYAGCEAVWLGSLNLKSVEPVLGDSCAQMPGFTNDFGLDSTTGAGPTTTVPALPSTTTTTPPTTTPPTTTTTPPPTTAPPTTAPPTTTTTVPADTTGPMISTASASPAQIWEQHPNLCSGQPKQSVISATATDPSGVTEMRATWTVGNFFEDEVMTGGATRTTTMGPYPYLTVAEVWPYTEDVTVTITATDGAGNTSQTTVVVTVTGAADCFG